MEKQNSQLVVSVTNRATLEQTWFNEVRTRKPQTFKTASAGIADPTDGGKRCDFCAWQMLTAEDAWGRVERPHAVTGSNLFKYGEPAHGLVLFKHHEPLAFTPEQLADFLSVSAGWFAAASAAHPDARHPFFIWNCGPRAGASQYHGHGQLMLTNVAVPAQALLTQQAALHAATHSGTSLYHDLVRAHAAVGLARVVRRGEDRCWLVAHLAPQKDMEVLLLGPGLTSPAFQASLHAVLRAMIDRLGVETFNCGALNVPLADDREVHFSAANGLAAADANSVDGVAHGNGGADGVANGGAAFEVLAGSGDDLGLPASGAGWRPMMARVVSRGKLASPASDFGCLEVVGHASIGHTDPFVLIRAIDEQLAAALGA
ncbi:hypothetical protein GPECTOR_78g55 [Gonium pectorale]|uniref:Galactose-1-phosphate uridyl transferase N-terminal domain-containing protein n=1 Tax=Gonium pectorale TaxID=33097 RepID=A0A150G1Y6_GONPE|nr:hypothetical protein GPECTOR_78g55 [Gonium pectorale]|eukprot:KXZ43867.1 hypothetical protein GPECTOR_78g55 [Gonium pectorale]